MKQSDWAERKAQQLLADATMLPHDNKGIWCCIKRVELIRLLRAERARAVRVCRKLAKHCNDKMTEDDSPEGQAVWSDKKDACLDCAAAIGGGR